MVNKTKNESWFPFGFQYPQGFTHSEAFPDPKIEAVRKRMEYLNKLHKLSGVPGHQFAAALSLFQKESEFSVDKFWDYAKTTFTMREVVEIAKALLPQVQNEPPRLEFPNAIALFDCRFVSTGEWEHIRRYSLGGSEASTVLGLSHFQSRRTLYHEKKTPYTEVKDIGKQHILDYGHSLECYIVNAVAERLGAVVYPEYRMWAHKKYQFITCNPDAILLFPDGHFALFEAKTAMWVKRKDWKDGVPDYYEPQPRHYLEVLDDHRLRGGYIGVCFGGLTKDLLFVPYDRDIQKGAAQIQAEVDFWNDYIVPGRLPDFSGNSDLDMTAQYRYVEHNVAGTKDETLPEESIALFEQFYSLQADKKVWDADAKEAKAKAAVLLETIKNDLPDGLTICSLPDQQTFHIRIKDSKKESVNMTKLREKPIADADALQKMANNLKEPALFWTVPKISKAKIVK